MAARTTPGYPQRVELVGKRGNLGYETAANTFLLQGALCALNAAGFAVMATQSAGLVVVGISVDGFDNTTGAPTQSWALPRFTGDGTATLGKNKADFEWGVFRFFNNPLDKVVAGDIGSDCYILDNQTVTHTNSSSSRAGKVVRIDTDGMIQVNVGDIFFA